MNTQAAQAVAHFSAGDLIAFCTLGAMAFAWVWQRIAALLKARGQRAAIDAVVNVKVEGLDEKFEALSAEIKEMRRQYGDHEKECAEFRGQISGDIARHADAEERTSRSILQLQGQIRGLMPPAGTFVELAPRKIED